MFPAYPMVTPELLVDADLATLVVACFHLKQQKDHIAEAEAVYRNEIARRLNSELEGTVTHKDIPGYKVTVTNKLTRRIEEDSFNAAVEDNPEWLDDLISFAPKLSLSEYRRLDDDERAAIDQCLVIKPAAPSVKIEELQDE